MTRNARTAARKHAKAQVALFAAEERHARFNTAWTRTVLEARQRDERLAEKALVAELY